MVRARWPTLTPLSGSTRGQTRCDRNQAQSPAEGPAFMCHRAVL
jgi:hypothetical protein